MCTTVKIDVRSGFYLDCNDFPPTPERLVELFEFLKGLNFATLFVNWSAVYPYSMDRRFCTDTAYAESVISDLHDYALKRDIEIIPAIAMPGNMRRFLGNRGYSHLRLKKNDASVLHFEAPGAVSFATELLSDYLSLSRDPCRILVVEEGVDSYADGQDERGVLERFFSFICQVIKNLGNNQMQPIVKLNNSRRNGGSVPLDFVDCAAASVRNCPGWSEALPSSLELYLDQVAQLVAPQDHEKKATAPLFSDSIFSRLKKTWIAVGKAFDG